ELSFSATTEAPVSTMKAMRWPSTRPSVRKWPRLSRGMERLRSPACTAVAAGAELRPMVAAEADALAAAGRGDILSAICAMKVPRPIRIAAKIIMLRMTPQTRFARRRFQHAGPKRATNGIRASCHFGEKDEQSVNLAKALPLHLAGRDIVSG